MSEESLEGNCLVAQSGGPTAVINASVAGVVTEALNHLCIEEIYGGLNGVLGILREDLIDHAEESQQNIRGLRYTPASALGTCRYKLEKEEDFERVIEVFQGVNEFTIITEIHKGKYGRILGTIMLPDRKISLNEMLLKEGHAEIYT